MFDLSGILAARGGLYLTRAVTPEQINSGQGSMRGLLTRVGAVREFDLDARTVELAFSSEAPVSRWFGDEVLDHSEGAMRRERIEGGAALLLNHDWDEQIGVVERVEIGADRVGRAVVRFGRGARADEIWGDVVDGIRRHVSVGYMVHRLDVQVREGQADLVRITDWEPYEISIVAVPADPTVGVGRVADAAGLSSSEVALTRSVQSPKGTTKMEPIIVRDGQGNLVRAFVDDSGNITQVVEVLEQAGAAEAAALRRGRESEQARMRAITEMGEAYGAQDLALRAVRDGTSPEAFQRSLLEHMNERVQRPLSEQSRDAEIGMTDREVRRFSFLRALNALANPTSRQAQEAAAFEFEASRAAAERSGRDPEGLLVPADVLTRAINTSTSGSGAGDTGGFSVATDLEAGSFIDLLRNRAVLMQLGTVMGGLVGNITIPGQASGATGYWIGEDAQATQDGLELNQLALSPKTVAAFSEVTRRLLMQSSLDMEALVRSDLATALALTIDLAGFYGTAAAGQPRGIVNYAGINAVDFGGTGAGAGAGALPSFTEVVEMETQISADNADVGSMAYVMSSGMRGHFKSTEKFAGSSGATIWEPGNTVNGYRTEVTNQVEAGALFFGNFADLMIGMWGGLELQADPYTHSDRGRVRITAFQDVDFVLRRVESFCYGIDASA